MHTLEMILNLILPWERSISRNFAPWTTFNLTPIHCWRRSVSAIVMSFEVVPPAKSEARTLRVMAFEDVGIV
jgi:hypothetical protein